jgi:hypothetical protein
VTEGTEDAETKGAEDTEKNSNAEERRHWEERRNACTYCVLYDLLYRIGPLLLDLRSSALMHFSSAVDLRLRFLRHLRLRLLRTPRTLRTQFLIGTRHGLRQKLQQIST